MDQHSLAWPAPPPRPPKAKPASEAGFADDNNDQRHPNDRHLDGDLQAERDARLERLIAHALALAIKRGSSPLFQRAARLIGARSPAQVAKLERAMGLTL